MPDPSFRHDAAAHRFTALVEGHAATLDYAPAGERLLDFRSTWVPPAARHHGLGSRLVRYALDHARSEGCRVIPSCWFVGDVVRRHPEYSDLLAH